MHTHGMTWHFCEHTEDAAKLHLTLIEVSMEVYESQFAKLNKLPTNKQPKYVARSFLMQSRQNALQTVERPQGEVKNKFEHIDKWSEDFKWKPIKVTFDSEVVALLDKLREYGYKEGEHWKVEEGSKVVFAAPPTDLL